jgi:RNA polymerase-binding transcription factor
MVDRIRTMALKKKQIEEFHKMLLQLRTEMTHQFEETTAEVKSPEESKGYSQHQADEGSDDFERTIHLQLSNTESEILKAIDRALEKIDEGSYGICDVTKEEIPLARLEAIPYATMTRDAQEAMEKGAI